MRRAAIQPLVPESPEPVGLVIADGGLGDHIPRFWAFVWGPVPDEVFDEMAARSATPARRMGDARALAACP